MPERGSSPTVRRRRLGSSLRELREAAAMTGADVAKQLDCSPSKISRIENAALVARPRDVRDMLDLYGVTDETHREVLMTMARQARHKGWWESYEEVLPAGLGTYVGLEGEATTLRCYDTHIVHGLLQTKDYARTLLHATSPGEPADYVDQLIELRMRRQEILSRADSPLELWAVMEEAVLRRPVGGQAVMRAQIEHLIEMCHHPNVSIQVLPNAVGAHAGLNGPLSLLEFEPSDPEVAYVEGQAGNIYLEKDRDIKRCKQAMTHLLVAALPVGDSVAMMEQIAKEID